MGDEAPPHHYVNNVLAHLGPLDLTLDFGCAIPGEQEPTLLVRLTMTWEEARILQAIVADGIAQYERLVGEIRDVSGGKGLDDVSQNGGTTGPGHQDPDPDPDSDPEPGS